MKNFIIAVLITIVFYTDLVVIQAPETVPFFLLIAWAAVEVVDDLVIEYRERLRKQKKLQKAVRRLILSKRV